MFRLNVFICIVALLMFGCMYKVAYAANDLEKWNSEQGRVARSSMKDKIATTTYRELPNHVDSSYRSTANGGKVLRQIETNATVKGSRVGTTIEALKDVDKMGAARKFASELGKGAVRYTAGAILIEAAMQEMLDGIGWIIDEGGKVQKKNPAVNDTDPNSPTNPIIYYNNQHHELVATTPQGVCKLSGYTYVRQGTWHWCVAPNGGRDQVQSKPNPAYNPSVPKPPSHIDVADAEMMEKIRDYFENPESPASKDLLIEQAVKPKGKASIKWSDDPSSEQTIYSDNKKTAEKVLDSDDPKGEGLTKETPKITDGTEGSADTTPKPDPNPNPNPDPKPDPNPPNPNPNPPNNGSSTSFNLPAFCDWASIVCDWIDWTKEEPELEGEKLDIEEQDITDYKYEDHVEWGSSCPFFEKTENLNMGVGVIKVKYNLSFFCDFGHSAKSTIVAIGHLGALIFLMIGIRSGASG